MTPSTLSMGTILKTKAPLSRSAAGSSPARKSKAPFIIHEELDSPGCTLAVRNTSFRSCRGVPALSSAEVTVTSGRAWPRRVRARVSTRNRAEGAWQEEFCK